ncbi:hypothetical protein [Actinocorallia libanotica]
MSVPPADGPLSDHESRLLIGLLRRFCDHEMDQGERWRLSTDHGPVHVLIQRAPLPGVPLSDHDDLDAWLAAHPGETADRA